MARYHGPVRFNVIGDRRLAAPYYGVARRFLGDLASRLAEAGISAGYQERRFNDGTVIRVQVAGEVYEIEIRVAQIIKVTNTPVLRGIVCTPNCQATGNIDVSYPEVILSPPSEEYGQTEWTTYFHSEIAPFFERVSSADADTYSDKFPNGVRRGGNIDWFGTDNIHLSWQGPETRYWHHRVEGFYDLGQFTPKVYCDGRELLDISDYATAESDTDFDGVVVGAGLRRFGTGFRLYIVMHETSGADIYNQLEGSSTMRLLRFNIVANGTGAYSDGVVEAGSGVVLDEWTTAFSYSPWFFNASCNKTVTITDDEDLTVLSPEEAYYTDAPANNTIVHMTFPDDGITSPSRTTDAITATTLRTFYNGAGTANVCADTALVDTSSVIAADYRGDELVFMMLHVTITEQDALGETLIVGLVRQISIGQRYYTLDTLRSYPVNTGPPTEHDFGTFHADMITPYNVGLLLSADIRYGALFVFDWVQESLDYAYESRVSTQSFKLVVNGSVVHQKLHQRYQGEADPGDPGSSFPYAYVNDVGYAGITVCGPDTFAPKLAATAGWLYAPGYSDRVEASFPNFFNDVGILFPSAHFPRYPITYALDYQLDADNEPWTVSLQCIDDKVYASASKRQMDPIPGGSPSHPNFGFEDGDEYVAYMHMTGGVQLPQAVGAIEPETRGNVAWVQDKPLKVA